MSKKANILIVDDNPDILDGLYFLLRKDYNITKAQNGKLALELLQKQSFDLVLLDIMMPEMNGFELAEQMIKQNIDVPFIFLTAKTENESKIKGLELGADDYIIKPFVKEELRLRIKLKLYTQEKINLRNKRLRLIHHNILTPTGVIQGYLELLNGLIEKIEKTLLSNRIADDTYTFSKKTWEKIKKQHFNTVEEMRQATAQLINMTKKFMETEVLKDFDVTMFKSIVKLDQLIFNAVTLVKPNKLQCHISEVPPNITLEVDIDKINQVFYELLDNIVLHNNQSTPTVNVTATLNKDNVVFSFSDNGRGIPQDDFQNIFGEFWSGYEDLHHTRGEGIGLWISKKYIDFHKGNIWIEKSEINKGTTICFSLLIY